MRKNMISRRQALIDFYLYMTIDEPVQLKILIVVSEGIYQLFGYFQQSHKEKELQNRENGHVFIYFQLELFFYTVNVLSADQGDRKEAVSSECHHLSVHQWNRHPVVAPQEAAFGSKFAKFLQIRYAFVTENEKGITSIN